MAQMKQAEDGAALRKLIKALLAISFGTILEWVSTRQFMLEILILCTLLCTDMPAGRLRHC
jgi:MFS-type transporter involved in bile tolerance (Atg22 family)